MLPSTEVQGSRVILSERAPREARLRMEHAPRYPDVRPERWDFAATVADRVLAGALLRGRLVTMRGRVLPDEHFEFRGGATRGGERQGSRPRREDR
ncbi:MAG TPA: hypothetical protein VMY76_10375 [Gemmatimonadales bacterium]|nr:hypothetical protein [Gemmatimonadales bacterium]